MASVSHTHSHGDLHDDDSILDDDVIEADDGEFGLSLAPRMEACPLLTATDPSAL